MDDTVVKGEKKHGNSKTIFLQRFKSHASEIPVKRQTMEVFVI